MENMIQERKSLFLTVCAIAFVMAVSVGSAGAANLLYNPGFELGAVSDSPGQTGIQNGWNYDCGGGYFRPETVLGPVVDNGQTFIYDGNEALDVCLDLYEGPSNMLLAQSIAVTADTWYTASAYVFAREMIEGTGLGTGASDYAGVRIQEFDGTGALVVDRGVAAIYDVTTGFVQVSQTFKTEASTENVYFILDTVLTDDNGYWGCRVIYDNCELSTVPEPASLLALLCGVSGLGGLMWRRRSE